MYGPLPRHLIALGIALLALAGGVLTAQPGHAAWLGSLA
jgi:hypothetical protein